MINLLKELIERYNAWDHSAWYVPPSIEREVTVNGRTIVAKYTPYHGGEFKFFNKEGNLYDLNGAGVFPTMRALFEAFSDVDMPKITYDLNKDDKHFKAKEKLYAMVMKSHGYQEKRFYSKKSIWRQEQRIWVKKSEKRFWVGLLERVVGSTSTSPSH